MSIQVPDTSSCDREPIHVPGSIQPHGVLLVVADDDGKVVQAAGDVETIFGCSNWEGASVQDLLGDALGRAILGRKTNLPRSVTLPQGGGPFDVSVVQGNGVLLVELEQAASIQLMADLMPKLESAVHAFDKAIDVPALMTAAARVFRQLTGFDRVMVYRFLDDAAGKVVAEEIAQGQHSFMNHHFPASDIPLQARALYVRNLVRVIPDVDYKPAPLRPEFPGDAPLDMSDVNLRSVSPIHIQYLKNMDVKASASFSIVQDGVLWGLVACHNSVPRGLPLDLRAAGRALCGALGRQIKYREETDAYRERVRLRTFEDRIVELLLREGSLDAALSRHLAEVQKMLGADGVAVMRGHEVVTTGECPGRDQIEGLAAWVGGMASHSIFATDHLSEESGSPLRTGSLAAGLLAMTLSASEPWMVFWFRAEAIEVVNWAGNPHKAASIGPDGALAPRASFEAWSETVRGKARRWSVAEVEAAERLAGAIQNVWQTKRIRDLNKELFALVDQKEALLKQREFLLGEVNHRVQNSLSLVNSFLSMQSRETDEPASREAIEEARRRISAVSLVHRRLYGSDQVRTVDGARYIDDLLDDLVASIGEDWRPFLKRDLVPVLLPNDRAISVGLILTELIINANKYAYGGSAGPLRISLAENGKNFRLVVEDQGEGRENAPSSRGFGSRMLEALVRQLNGSLDLVDNAPGTRAILSAPIDFVGG